MKFELVNQPEDLPPGEYRTKVLEAKWVDGDLHITLAFDGPVDPNNPCLFTITKHTE